MKGEEKKRRSEISKFEEGRRESTLSSSLSRRYLRIKVALHRLDTSFREIRTSSGERWNGGSNCFRLRWAKRRRDSMAIRGDSIPRKELESSKRVFR